MFILHLILLVVFCIVERFWVMKAPDGILLIPVVSITICLFSCAFPLIWMCISLSSYSLALGVVDLAVMLEFFFLVLFLLGFIVTHYFIENCLHQPQVFIAEFVEFYVE